MLKQLALVTILGVALMGSVLSAQSAGGTRAVRPRVQAVVRVLRARIQRGVRAGRITPAELATLRSEIQALRSRVQTLRQAGQPLAQTQRQELRQELRRIVGEVKTFGTRK